VTNSVRHGAGDEVILSVRTTPETVRVEVSDRGPGFSPVRRAKDADEASGWGLYLWPLSATGGGSNATGTRRSGSSSQTQVRSRTGRALALVRATRIGTREAFGESEGRLTPSLQEGVPRLESQGAG
jgi:hypothetical protein